MDDSSSDDETTSNDTTFNDTTFSSKRTRKRKMLVYSETRRQKVRASMASLRARRQQLAPSGNTSSGQLPPPIISRQQLDHLRAFERQLSSDLLSASKQCKSNLSV